MKKLRVFALSFLMVCLSCVMFVACGKKDDKTTPPSPPKPVVVKYYTCGGDIPFDQWVDDETFDVVVMPLNPGSTDAYYIDVQNGGKVKEPLPEKEGEVFLGWYEDSNYTKQFDFTAAVTNDYSLYAKWGSDISEIFTLSLNEEAEPYYTIVACNARVKEIEIPDSYNEIPITTIGANAFDGAVHLEKLTVPATFKAAGADAFKGCTNLQYTTYKGEINQWIDLDFANIYSNPAYVASVMFQLSSGPMSEAIVVDMERVKPYAFSGIPARIEMTTNVKSIAAGAFEGSKTSIALRYEGTITDWLKIDFESYTSNPLPYVNYLYLNGADDYPRQLSIDVENVPKYSLAGLKQPKTITFTSKVKTIGEGAFQGAGFTSLDIPETIESVGESAFKDCNQLTSLSISGATEFGKNAFADCKNLTSISYFTATKADGQVVNYSDDNLIFYNAGIEGDGITLNLLSNQALCENLFVPNGVENNPKITTLTFGQDWQEIENCEEYGKFTYLNDIVVPENITYIEFGILDNTPWFKNHADGCVTINNKVYGYKGSTENVVIPVSAEGYYNKFFDYVRNMKSLEIPFVGYKGYVTTEAVFGSIFSEESFDGSVPITQKCESGDKTYYIPSTLKKIACSNLQTIEYGAFSGLGCIEELDFSKSLLLNLIKSYAFYGFADIEKIILPERVVEVESDLYEGMPEKFIEVHYLEDSNSETHGSVTDNGYANKVGLVTLRADSESNYIAVWCDAKGETYLRINDTNPVSVKLSYETIDVYVKFLRRTYTIAFENNDYNHTTSSMDVTFGQPFTLEDPVRNGYDFLGWYLDGGEGEKVESGVYLFEENIQLSAKWSDPIFKLWYNPYGEHWRIDGLTDYGKTKEDLYIPNIIDGTEIKEIWNSMGGSTNRTLTNVTVDHIPQLAAFSFSFLPNLRSVTLIGVQVIDSYSFQECENLSYIDLGSDVTEIGLRAFASCSSLTEITINNVKTIGNQIFENCENLTDVTFGSGVETIGSKVFNGCKKLKNLTIGDDVTTIGESAFEYCESLTNITLGKGVKTIGKSAFGSCHNVEEVNYTGEVEDWLDINFENDGSNPLYFTNSYYYSQGNYAVLKIGGTVVEKLHLNRDVKPYAFAGVRSLETVTFGDAVATIGGGAFKYCVGLTSLDFNKVTTIEEGAFYYCEGLASIDFGSVKTIAIVAFCGCSALTELNLNGEVELIGSRVFESCNNLTSVHLGIKIKTLEGDFLSGLRNDVTITYDGTIDDWMNITFNKIDYNYNGLLYHAEHFIVNGQEITELKIDRDIPDYAFYNFIKLRKITFGINVKNLGEKCLWECRGIEEVVYEGTIDDWVKINFGAWPLYFTKSFKVNGQEDFETLTIDSESISANAFNGFSSLKHVIFTDNVKSIGEGAFSGCKNLQSVTIGNGETEIGESVFSGCKNLQTVTIGTGSKSFKMYAFSSCEALTKVIYQGTLDEWEQLDFEGYFANPVNFAGHLIINGAETTTLHIDHEIKPYVFAGLDTLTTLTFGDNVTSIPEGAFTHCNGLTNLVIGNNITTIGDSAFYNCENLRSIIIGDSVTSIGNIAFYQCDKVEEIVIGAGVQEMGNNVFYKNEGIKVVVTIKSAVVYNLMYNFYDGGNLVLEAKTVKVLASIVDDESNNSVLLHNTRYFTKSKDGDYYIFTRTNVGWWD